MAAAEANKSLDAMHLITGFIPCRTPLPCYNGVSQLQTRVTGGLTMRILLGAVTVAALVICSLSLSRYTENSDFPVFYRAARTVLDPGLGNLAVYAPPAGTPNYIPEKVDSFGSFIYSLAAAYLLAPLGLLPYYTAKGVMIFANAAAYLGALALVGRSLGARGRYLFYPVALGFLWPPFLQDLRCGQLNPCLLFLIVSGALAAGAGRPYLGGALLGAASLFKLFPLSIALILGVKDRRIIGGCALVLLSSFAIPGATHWFEAMARIHQNYSPLYLLLGGAGSPGYGLFIALVLGITLLRVHRHGGRDFLAYAALAVPATLLVLPITEYYHYTLTALCFMPFASSPGSRDRATGMALLAAAAAIGLAYFFSGSCSRFPTDHTLSNGLLLLASCSLWGAALARLRGPDPSTSTLPEAQENR